jgi:YidC/Oxa1 family membrane protein insertase
MLLQIPIFISLFHTLREIKPLNSTCNPHLLTCYPHTIAGFSQGDIKSAALAKIFGVPISVSFKTSADVLHHLGGGQTSTRILAAVLTVLMGATTFITQRQLMAQNSASGNSQMAQQQKIILYLFPLMFLFYGFAFPIGVLLYWLTTNVWSMAQQRVVIRRMEPVAAAGASGGAPIPAGPPPGAKPKAAPTPKPSPANGGVTLPPGGAIPASPSRPSSNARRPNNNRSKNRKKGRR